MILIENGSFYYELNMILPIIREKIKIKVEIPPLIIHFLTKDDLNKFSKFISTTKINNLKNIVIEKKTNIVNLFLQNNISKKSEKINELINSGNNKKWKKLWKEMPKFFQQNIQNYKSILVLFKTKKAKRLFSKIIDEKITDKTRFIYFPKIEVLRWTNCICKKILNPIYPIYIISKGRWESRLTSKTLEYMKVPYHIVVEPQEYDNYAAVINPKKIKVLPFSNLNQGGIPARNWVWEDSLKNGYKRHWILDDNIRGFYRLYNNKKYYMTNGNNFYVVEQFVDRFKNIGMAGMHYQYFIARKGNYPPFYLNTRIYSCILLDNSLPFRWRGKYNEDTDLSLRILKSGLCTILFNALLCGKITTMVMKGGNTEEVYKKTNNRSEFAESLVEQHPDVTKKIWRYGRWHHQVDYSSFKNNKLIYNDGVKLKNKNKEYGMVLYD
ncbi:hypothetical protein M0P65_05840 [Candidatus Gracilibacteria bacterium]|jgi:hypothetical protein|nr:hypothetical protein [Candidatus Gracilibacteria bacterium]